MDRIAVVTGANRGIGQEIARQLAAAGLRVVGTSREDGPHRLDVTDPASVSALARGLERVDVLVNNAGTSMNGFDERVARETLDTNYRGAARVTDALLPKMAAGARVVMVSSGLGHVSCLSPDLQRRFLDPALTRAGLDALADEFVRDVAEGVHASRGWPTSAYSVSKVAMNMLARLLARDLAEDPRGILVNTANPGWVRTRMGGARAPRTASQGAETPVWLALLPDAGPSGGFFSDKRRVDW